MRLDPLYVLPFASAAVWILAAFAPFPRGRPRTPTELAFALFAALLGGWALLDGVYLQASDPGTAVALARARDAVASLGGLSLLWFAKWSTRGRAAADVAFAVPVLAAIAIGWNGIQGVVIESWGPRTIRNVPFFAVWFAQSFVYVMASLVYIGVGLRALWRHDRPIALRGLFVVVATGIATVLAVTTNIAISFTGSTAPPPFSSLLVVPGAALLLPALLVPLPRARVLRTLRRMVRAFGRDVLGASLLGEDGTVYGIAMQRPVDRQQFDLPEVMVALQQFLVASPRGPPKSLAVPVGDVTFLLRRRDGMTLVLAVRGRDHDVLEAAVEDAFARLESLDGVLTDARAGSIPAMATIHGLLQDLVATPD